MTTHILSENTVSSIKTAVERIIAIACGDQKHFALFIYDAALEKSMEADPDLNRHQSVVIVAACPTDVLETSLCMTLQAMGHTHDDEEKETDAKETQH